MYRLGSSLFFIFSLMITFSAHGESLEKYAKDAKFVGILSNGQVENSVTACLFSPGERISIHRAIPEDKRNIEIQDYADDKGCVTAITQGNGGDYQLLVILGRIRRGQVFAPIHLVGPAQ